MKLEECLKKMNDDASADDVVEMLKVLAETQVCMPMRVEMSEADAAQFANAKKGDRITTENDMHLIPTQVKIPGDKKTIYLPIFSDEKEIKPSYGQYFSKINMPMSEVLRILDAHQKANGLILNMFSQAVLIKDESLKILREIVGA